MWYKNIEKRKEKIREFIRKNPTSTHKEIKKLLHTKVEKLYEDGMAGAFKDAGIPAPRTFTKKTKEEKKRILIEYVKKNPRVGGHTIKKETKINFQTIFKTTKEIFDAAEIEYPRKADKRTREEKKNAIIELIKEDPLLTVLEIMQKLSVKPYSFFKNMQEIYKKAKVKEINRSEKRRIKKQVEVISFIKDHPFATQREINNFCRTHVQNLFKKGIFEAYAKAGVEFPYERLKQYGIGLKNIRKRSKAFEDEIARKLSGYGKVDRLVKTKRGFADIILERKDKKVIIEVKDYRAKEISITQINQLKRYVEDTNAHLGILICHQKPKRDNFLREEDKIMIINEEEIRQIPQFIDKGA